MIFFSSILFPYYSPLLLSSSSEGVVSPHGTSGYTGERIVRASQMANATGLYVYIICDAVAAAAAAVADEPRSGSTFCNSRSPSRKKNLLAHTVLLLLLYYVCVCVIKKIVSLVPMGSKKKKKKAEEGGVKKLHRVRIKNEKSRLCLYIYI